MADPDAGGPPLGSRRAVVLAVTFALVAHLWFIVSVSLSKSPF